MLLCSTDGFDARWYGFLRWAVIARYVQNAYRLPTFQSSQILSRQRTLDDANLDRAKVALREFNIEGL